MRTGMLTNPEDLQWLLDTHLNGVPLPSEYVFFGSALLQGNEDSPEEVHLFVNSEPSVEDNYLRVRFTHTPPVYCEYIECEGKTNAPKWTPVTRDELFLFTEDDLALAKAFATKYMPWGCVIDMKDDAELWVGMYGMVPLPNRRVTLEFRIAADDTEDYGEYENLADALAEIAAMEARRGAANWLASL